ncbi:MAG: (2Fe-2S)-binding protein [Rubricoccaceae bacterium]|nr:(2Fe-2S)-binding protein [Rubricoccaceae bacterium]
MSIRIDRCFCFLRLFSELKDVAEQTGSTTIRELQQHVQFGENCQLCHPYVSRMLRTGEEVFDEIVETEQEV